MIDVCLLHRLPNVLTPEIQLFKKKKKTRDHTPELKLHERTSRLSR